MGITAEDLCGRLSITRPTLRRMENGDPSASAALYLGALNVLGLLGQAAPRLESHLWESATLRPRTRSSQDAQDDYF
jgi:transcriptional regulator with XRE-family HTH domain